MLFHEIEKNSLIRSEYDIWCTPGNPNKKYIFSSMNYKLIKKNSILLVVHVNIGSTFKENYIVCIVNNKVFYIQNSMPNNNLDNHFKKLL